MQLLRSLSGLLLSDCHPNPPTTPWSLPLSLAAAGSVSDHLLQAYRAAFASLLKAQFTPKRLPGGEEGAAELAEQVGEGRVGWAGALLVKHGSVVLGRLEVAMYAARG